jgi:hypothetical protein
MTVSVYFGQRSGFDSVGQSRIQANSIIWLKLGRAGSGEDTIILLWSDPPCFHGNESHGRRCTVPPLDAHESCQGP